MMAITDVVVHSNDGVVAMFLNSVIVISLNLHRRQGYIATSMIFEDNLSMLVITCRGCLTPMSLNSEQQPGRDTEPLERKHMIRATSQHMQTHRDVHMRLKLKLNELLIPILHYQYCVSVSLSSYILCEW